MINKITEDDKADMIVMVTHGASGIGNLSKFVLGSNAYPVVHGAHCTVVTSRERTDSLQFKTYVLPLEITKETSQKVELAIEWANRFDATIHLI